MTIRELILILFPYLPPAPGKMFSKVKDRHPPHWTTPTDKRLWEATQGKTEPPERFSRKNRFDLFGQHEVEKSYRSSVIITIMLTLSGFGIFIL